MIPPNSNMSLEQALVEIERLRDRLAAVEHHRDSLRRDLEKLLPPLPPELQYLDAAPKEVMKDSIPFDEAFIQSLKAENP